MVHLFQGWDNHYSFHFSTSQRF